MQTGALYTDDDDANNDANVNNLTNNTHNLITLAELVIGPISQKVCLCDINNDPSHLTFCIKIDIDLSNLCA